MLFKIFSSISLYFSPFSLSSSISFWGAFATKPCLFNFPSTLLISLSILSFSFVTITYKIISEASIDVIVKLTLTLLPIIFYGITLPIVALFRKSFPKVELDLGVNKSKKLRKLLWIVLTLIIIPIIISIFI